MKLTKKDEKAIKTVASIVQINIHRKNEGKGRGLTRQEYTRHTMAKEYLQSRFGKDWMLVAKDWLDIQEIKKKDLQKELNAQANPM